MKRILSVVSGVVLLGTTGCATNGYVRSEVDPLADRLAKLEAKTNSLEANSLGKPDRTAIQQANDKADRALSGMDRALSATQDLQAQVKGANDKAQQALDQTANLNGLVQGANDKSQQALDAANRANGLAKEASDKSQQALAGVKQSDEDAKKAQAAADRAEAAATASEQAAKKSEKAFALEQHK